MRRATVGEASFAGELVISIHALHEESDSSSHNIGEPNNISIHALHEESDLIWSATALLMLRTFQSTLSMRRATTTNTVTVKPKNISIHALHEESDHHHPHRHHPTQAISIHALHEESDSTVFLLNDCPHISIHALHEESDRADPRQPDTAQHFNPRSP